MADMTKIDTIATVADGTVAMIETVSRHISGEDGYESTEERLFAVLVQLIQKYATMTLTESFPVGIDPMKKQAALARSVQTALQALEENLHPSFQVPPEGESVHVYVVAKDRAGDGGFNWSLDPVQMSSHMARQCLQVGSNTVLYWVEVDVFVPKEAVHAHFIQEYLEKEYAEHGWSPA